MLSMVLLVLLLCFEPAKASLFQPAKATLFLGLCMQPAKARPPLPWWRCRVWENKYWLCSPDGYGRGLTEEEEDEIEEIFDRNTDAAKYVWQQSSEHLAGNCWRWASVVVSIWRTPQCRHPRLLPALGRLECLAAWKRLCEEDWACTRLGTAAAAVSLHKATNGLSKGKDNPEPGQGLLPGPGGLSPGHLTRGPMSLQRLPLRLMHISTCTGAKEQGAKGQQEGPCKLLAWKYQAAWSLERL